MKLENITLSEVIMAQKTKHHMFCFIVFLVFGFWLLNFIYVYLPGIKGPREGARKIEADNDNVYEQNVWCFGLKDC